MRDWKEMKFPLYIMAALLFGLKTYILYRFMFNMKLENVIQEIILFINPFVSAYLVFAISVWFRKKSVQMAYIRYTILAGTLILYFNLLFYRSFTDFLTIPQLFQTSNAGQLGSSILSLINVYDMLLLADVALIWYLSKKKQASMHTAYGRRGRIFATVMILVLITGNFFLAEIERPQLFTRAFDREYLVKNIGLFNYHIYDIFQYSKAKTQRVFADDNDMSEIKQYMESDVRTGSKSDIFGEAKGKNVIFISAESVEEFVINREVDGDDITPFLNELANDEDTYYFDHFYHQTEQGKTSDSEFLLENSLYPSSRGAVFFTHGQNEYHALPEILGENGYYTAVLHANNKSFWNRDQMYESMEYDMFYDEEYYEVDAENSVGWGLKDKPYFEQSMEYLESMDEPFYVKFLTLTNHFPYELDEEDMSIDRYDSNSATLNNYFPTVRYTDEAIENFFDELKQSGLYEESVIIIMGDHYGISANHNKAMADYLGKEEITPFDLVQLERVPLFIHIPGSGEGDIISRVSGQIDLKPTILHMLGIETNDDIYFGNDLFADNRKEFIALRNGDFISDEYLYTNNQCYARGTMEILESNGEEGVEPEMPGEKPTPCDPIAEKAEQELSYSDKIIFGDLLRFHDFKKE